MSRVLVVTNDFPTRRGGIESFVFALCEQLPPDEIVVYTASMAGDAEFDARLAFPVYRDPSSVLLPTPAVARRAAEIMARHGCDRVMFGASAPLGLLAPTLRRAGAQRIVALTHGHEVWWARVPIARHLLRQIGDSVDVLTYVSRWCRDEIAPTLSPAAIARMRPLSPGVDTDRFRPGVGGKRVRRSLGIPESAPVVVCVARMVARKGQDTLLRAWPSVRATWPDARLVLVGDGANRPRIERMVNSMEGAESISLIGAVDWGDVPGFMDAADVFAMPCRTRRFGLEPEAFGIVFLEAQACGVPVVVGDSGGAPETVVNPRYGVVVQSDAYSVSRALTQLLDDAGAKAAVRADRAQLALRWGWDACAARLTNYLELTGP